MSVSNLFRFRMGTALKNQANELLQCKSNADQLRAGYAAMGAEQKDEVAALFADAGVTFQEALDLADECERVGGLLFTACSGYLGEDFRFS